MGGLLSLVWPPQFLQPSAHRAIHDSSSDPFSAALQRISSTGSVAGTSRQHQMDDHQQKRREREGRDSEDDEEDYKPFVESADEDESSCSDWSLESTSDEDDITAILSEFIIRKTVQEGHGDITSEYRFLVPNIKDYNHLREDLQLRNGTGRDSRVGVMETCRRAELGMAPKGVRHTQLSAIPERVKCTMVNRFPPCRRQQLYRAHTKFFCCQYMPTQQQMVVGSQSEEFRFFRRHGDGTYDIDRNISVPYTGWSILDVACSPDGRLLCYSTWSESVFVGQLEAEGGEDCLGGWLHNGRPDDGKGWRNIHVLPDGRSSRMAMFCLKFSRDGKELLCGGADHRVHVVDMVEGRRTFALRCHDDDVNAISWGDENPNYIYTGSDDGLCKLWDRRIIDDSTDGVPPVGEFAGHRDGITYVDTRGDERYILTNSKDQTIKVWDIRRFSPREGVSATRIAVSKQQWDYRWQTFPETARDPTPMAGDASLATLKGHAVLHTLVRARWSPERTGRRYIYTGCAKGDVIIYDTLEMRPLERLEGHGSVVRDCYWTEDTNEIFTTSWDGTTAVWQWDDRKEKKEMKTNRRQKLKQKDPKRRRTVR